MLTGCGKLTLRIKFESNVTAIRSIFTYDNKLIFETYCQPQDLNSQILFIKISLA